MDAAKILPGNLYRTQTCFDRLWASRVKLVHLYSTGLVQSYCQQNWNTQRQVSHLSYSSMHLIVGLSLFSQPSSAHLATYIQVDGAPQEIFLVTKFQNSSWYGRISRVAKTCEGKSGHEMKYRNVFRNRMKTRWIRKQINPKNERQKETQTVRPWSSDL